MEPNLLQAVAAAGIRQAIAAITTCNDKTVRYGLMLTPSEAAALVKTRKKALHATGRIEFGKGILDKLIMSFCSSPYLNRSSYTETLHALIEIFYHFKNECMDLISDDELLDWMRTYFDTSCQGSLELLKNRELEQMAYNIRHGTFNFNSSYHISDYYDGGKDDSNE